MYNMASTRDKNGQIVDISFLGQLFLLIKLTALANRITIKFYQNIKDEIEIKRKKLWDKTEISLKDYGENRFVNY